MVLSKRTNKINDEIIVQRIEEEIKLNPYVSYESLVQLDTSMSIDSVLEHLIDTKKLVSINLKKPTKYGKHKWQWK